jgi:hypothetical protein
MESDFFWRGTYKKTKAILSDEGFTEFVEKVKTYVCETYSLCKIGTSVRSDVKGS